MVLHSQNSFFLLSANVYQSVVRVFHSRSTGLFSSQTFQLLGTKGFEKKGQKVILEAKTPHNKVNTYRK